MYTVPFHPHFYLPPPPSQSLRQRNLKFQNPLHSSAECWMFLIYFSAFTFSDWLRLHCRRGDTKSPSFASFRRVGRFRPFYSVKKKKQQGKSKENPSDERVWMCFFSKRRLVKSKYFIETSARVDGSDFAKLVEFAIMQKFAGFM